MSKRLSRIILAAAGAVALTGVADTALAQVGDIIVTTQRRAQSLQKVPVPVSAFNTEQLEIRQMSELLDVMNKIPNLIGFHNTGPGSAASIFMRGIGSPDSIATFDPPVAVYVDDVFVARTNANNFGLFDVERVEVMRGPQGIAFGRNTTGGVIHLITRRPSEEFSVKAEAEYGQYERRAFNASVNVPVSPKILTKVSGYVVTDNGFVDNLTTGEDSNDESSHGVRGDIRFLPTDRVTWDIAVEYMSLTGSNVGTLVTEPRVSRTGIRRAGTPGNLEDLLVRGEGLGNETETISVYSHLLFDIGENAELEFITGYRDLDWDFTLDFVNNPSSVGGFTIVNVSEHKQFTQEAKLTGNFEVMGFPIDYLTGVFYMDEDNLTDFTDVVPGPTVLISRILENDTKNISIFAQADVGLTDQLTLQAGGRWTRERKDIDYTTRLDTLLFGTFNVASISGGISTASIKALGIPTEQVTKKFTPRVALLWDATDDVMLFASATNGIKSAGWNARGGVPSGIRPFGPEKVWSYELGVKGDFWDDQVRLNANLFYFDVNNLQLVTGFPGPNPGDAPVFITQNAGNLDVWGLEAEMFWSPLEGLDFYSSVGVMDAEYSDITDIGNRITDDSTPQRTPTLTAAIGGTYTHFMPDMRGNVVLGLEGIYQGDNFKTSTTPPESFQEAYWTMSARVGWQSEVGRWGIFAECKNCTDKKYLTSYFLRPYYGNPQRFNLSVKFNY